MTPLLEARGLKKYFKNKAGMLHAVDGVNVQLDEGKTLGVVGESGCGKTTLGRTILHLIDPTGGQIFFEGEDVSKPSRRTLSRLREKMQIIFQDPYSSLNPRMSLSEAIMEPLVLRGGMTKMEMREETRRLMDVVGIASRFENSYPHELDGGRRQRIGIARALVLKPKFIVCDEPVSALDVSVQAQILNLMMDLQDKMGLAYMFVSHDLSVVRHISQEVAVMYLGQCVERAATDKLFNNPKHPYTQALLDAIPVPNLSSRSKKRVIIEGEVTSPINPAPGCRFAPRCPYVREECTGIDIEYKECAPGHFVSCIKY